MRILIINDKIPYPVISGAPLRTHNLLRRIAREHEVWLVAFVENPEQAEGVAHMQQFCQGVETVRKQQCGALDQPVDWLSYLLLGKPPDLRFYNSQELACKIRHLASTIDFDVVQIEHASMGLFLEALPDDMHEKTIWMLHDIDWEKFSQISLLDNKRSRSLRSWLHSCMMRWWKPGYASQFERCITVSEADRNLLLGANPRLHVDVVPNGVDTNLYQSLPWSNESSSLIFVGNMAYRPNIDAMSYFCQEIFPQLRDKIADIEMWIVGLNPPPEILRLDGNGVHVTGRVEDLRPYYSRSTVCVVPLRGGGGTRLKILEAMALGRPVVSTSIGCKGLDVIDGKHLLIADNPNMFIEKTLSLLTDEGLRQYITKQARELVVSCYDWEVIASRLVQIYSELQK